MKIQYLEIVTPDVDGVCEAYAKASGGFDRMAANDASMNRVLVLPDGSGKSIF